MIDPNKTPGQNLDLSNWKVQLPVARPGSATYLEVDDLDTFQSAHFRTGPDGALALSAPVDGVTTSGARYARSELRELTDGRNAAWTLQEGGRMAAVMEIDALATERDGTPGRIVIGQVHGGEGQLVRLYYQDGQLTWCDGRNEANPRDTYHAFANAQGKAPQVGLNERFAYGIDVSAGRVSLWIEADGDRFQSAIPMPAGWSDNVFYFKAGLYLGTNEETSSGSAQVSVFSIGVSHTSAPPVIDRTLLVETPTAPPAPDPSDPPTGPATTHDDGGLRAKLAGTDGDDVFAVAHKDTRVEAKGGFDTVVSSVDHRMAAGTERLELVGGARYGRGTNDADQMVGSASGDTLEGSGGDDVLWGGSGNDVLVGGSASDTLFGGGGADRFVYVAQGHIGGDRIADFTRGQDRIDLSGLDANTRLSGDQDFTWGWGRAGSVRWNDGHLEIDRNGDGRADAALEVDGDAGALALTASDILL